MIHPFYKEVSWPGVAIFLLVGFQVLLGHLAPAQTLTVRGQVDGRHLSLPDVRVVASQSAAKASTDQAGKFTLVVVSQDTLTLSHPSFPTRQYVLPVLTNSISLYFDMADGEGFWVNETDNTRGAISATAPLSVSLSIPDFPWPVPAPSAKVVLDTRYFAQVSTLAQADTRLAGALQKSGYPAPSYYQIPNGFAMVSQIEQIEPDGTPKQSPARWSAQVEPFSKGFSLSNYLMLLFRAATGHFRVLVFLVTDVPAEKKKDTVDPQTATAWYSSGVDFLPPVIGRQPYTNDYRVTALIYEFRKPENSKAQQLTPSGCLGQDHLTKSMITAHLTK